MKTVTGTAILAGLAAAPSGQAAEATAQNRDQDGNDLGAVPVEDMPSGLALAPLTLIELPERIHAVHLRETGDCWSEDIRSAGGQIAGDPEHGVAVEGGPHPGDLRNLTVKENGVGEVQVFLSYLDVERDTLDDEGTAFVIRQSLDDHQSQPSRNAGDRIACGAFTERE